MASPPRGLASRFPGVASGFPGRGRNNVLISPDCNKVKKNWRATSAATMPKRAKRNTEAKAVLAALAATPSLAQSVDEATGITAVMKAIRGKDVGVVKAVLGAFPSGVNVADKNGATPLHHAVVYQNLEIISVLVGAGADLSARDIHGETQVELARKLLKQGHHRTDLVVKALEAVNN